MESTVKRRGQGLTDIQIIKKEISREKIVQALANLSFKDYISTVIEIAKL